MDYEDRIKLADSGCKLWLKLTSEYGITKSDYVVIVPEDDPKINELTVRYLDEFMTKRNINRVFIMGGDDAMGSDEIQVITLTEEELNSIVQLYELYEFAANVIFASLDIPSGRLGRGLLTKDNVELDDIFKSVVYGI